MPTSYTSLIGLALPVTGELSGTWGDVVNNYITNYLDSAVAGTQTISGSQTAVTLSVTNGSSLVTAGSGATGSAQFQIINCTGNPAGLLTITAPASSRQYIIINATSTSQSVKIVGTGPTTGVTLIAGEKAHVAWNGSDFVKIATQSGNGDFVTVDTTNLEVTNIKAKDGTAAASIADSTGVISITSNPILSGGTANGVLYLNGSKVATSGSALTFDGTNFVNTAGYLGTTQSGATSSYFIAKNSIATSGVVFGAHSSGAGYIDVINNNPLFFATNDTERMRLDSSGKLLINATTSPSAATVKAAIQGAAGADSYYQFGNGSGGGGLIGSVVSGGIQMYTYTGAFGSETYTERMRIDSSGNLGLGVTPSAWSTSFNIRAFQLGGGSVYSYNNDRIFLGQNVAITGGGADVYLNAAAASTYRQYQGTHVWYNAPSGTVGAAISFTQAMTLDASGNLGIGTSSPASKLNLGGVADQTIQINGSGTAAFVGTSTSVAQISSNRNPTTGAIYDAARAVSYINLEAANGNGNIQFYTTTTNNVNATERMRITAAGNLGIGTSSPVTRLDVVGAGTLTSGTAYSTVITRQDTTTNRGIFLGYDSSGQIGVIGSDSAGAGSSIAFWTYTGSVWGERARITSGGDFIVNDSSGSWSSGTARVKITQTGDNIGAWITNGSLGTTYPVLFLENYQAASSTKYLMRGDNSGGTSIRIATNGDVTNTNGSYGTISDAKMKTDIVDAGSQWEDIKAIRFRKFKMKNDPSGLLQLGVVAQELEQTSPGLVEEHADYEQVEITDEEGNVKKERQPTGTTTKSVKTSVLLMKAAVALQEAMTRIEQLEAKVAALESKGA